MLMALLLALELGPTFPASYLHLQMSLAALEEVLAARAMGGVMWMCHSVRQNDQGGPFLMPMALLPVLALELGPTFRASYLPQLQMLLAALEEVLAALEHWIMALSLLLAALLALLAALELALELGLTFPARYLQLQLSLASLEQLALSLLAELKQPLFLLRALVVEQLQLALSLLLAALLLILALLLLLMRVQPLAPIHGQEAPNVPVPRSLVAQTRIPVVILLCWKCSIRWMLLRREKEPGCLRFVWSGNQE
jgi:hypothetical protein